jgi:hypothetical protein
MRWNLQFAAMGLALASPCAAQTQATSSPLTGDWYGVYVCAQGRTGLTLTIDRQTGDRFTGYFHFYPPRDNPAAKAGCFSVEGDVDAQGRVNVRAGQWITRPQGYVTVSLDGLVSGAKMSGAVTVEPPYGDPPWSASCATFRLSRLSARPSINALCQRNVAQATTERAP